MLYVVATPIGNLADFSPRAREVLGTVTLVLAEDTRHSRKLLDHFHLHPRIQALHAHNEREETPRLIARLERGESLALISDAGMPLVSDPGYPLLKAVRERQLPVLVIPGPSAVLAALAASGLPSDRFCFEGFLPAKTLARRAVLEALVQETRTLIFFESPRRVLETVGEMCAVFGPARAASLGRELTKVHEEHLRLSLGALRELLEHDPGRCRGELVLVVAGSEKALATEDAALEKILGPLLRTLPLSQAVTLATEISDAPKKQVYRLALALKARGMPA